MMPWDRERTLNGRVRRPAPPRLTDAQKDHVRAVCAAVPGLLATWTNPTAPPDIVDAAGHANDWRWNSHSEHVTTVACRAFLWARYRAANA